jgi:hypothetical protein
VYSWVNEAATRERLLFFFLDRGKLQIAIPELLKNIFYFVTAKLSKTWIVWTKMDKNVSNLLVRKKKTTQGVDA